MGPQGAPETGFGFLLVLSSESQGAGLQLRTGGS